MNLALKGGFYEFGALFGSSNKDRSVFGSILGSPSIESLMWMFPYRGVPVVAVFVIRASLLFGAYVRAPDFWKLPYTYRSNLFLFSLFEGNGHISNTLDPNESSFERGPTPVCLFHFERPQKAQPCTVDSKGWNMDVR